MILLLKLKNNYCLEYLPFSINQLNLLIIFLQFWHCKADQDKWYIWPKELHLGHFITAPEYLLHLEYLVIGTKLVIVNNL